MHISQILCSFLQKKKNVGLCAKRKDKTKSKGWDEFIKHLWAAAGSHYTDQDGPLLPFNFDEHAVDVFILRSNPKYECNFKIMGIYAYFLLI